MNMVILIFITAFLNSGVCFVDKWIMNKGVSRKEYFYYTCLTMIPFALLTITTSFIWGEIKFEFSFIPVLFLFIAMFLRYRKQFAIAGMSQALAPFENVTYMSLGLLVAYVIDVVIKVRAFDYISLIAVLITLIGVFSLARVKLNVKSLRKDLVIRICCEIGLGYVAHFILSYWSNEIYILLTNVLLVLFSHQSVKPKNKVSSGKIIRLFLIQQLFGFAYIYLYNYLSVFSVTTSSFVKPVTILVTVILSVFIGKKERPTIKDVISIILVTLGVLMINVC